MCVNQVDGRDTSLSLDDATTTSPTDAALFDEIKKLAASLGEQVSIYYISDISDICLRPCICPPSLFTSQDCMLYLAPPLPPFL
jgi:hypothetical protein